MLGHQSHLLQRCHPACGHQRSSRLSRAVYVQHSCTSSTKYPIFTYSHFHAFRYGNHRKIFLRTHKIRTRNLRSSDVSYYSTWYHHTLSPREFALERHVLLLHLESPYSPRAHLNRQHCPPLTYFPAAPLALTRVTVTPCVLLTVLEALNRTSTLSANLTLSPPRVVVSRASLLQGCRDHLYIQASVGVYQSFMC